MEKNQYIKNKKLPKSIRIVLVLASLIALLLSVSSIVLPQKAVDNIQKIEDCINVQYEAEEKVYDTCISISIQKYCDDEPINTSCHENITDVTYNCFKGMQNVTKVKKACATKGFIINDVIKLNTEEYACSHTLEGENIIVLCDSRFDGNGDGICTSGESCQKFVIKGTSVQQFEKNSREDFIESDDSFFLDKASAEVLR